MPTYGPWLPTDPEDRAGGLAAPVGWSSADLDFTAALEGPEDEEIVNSNPNLSFELLSPTTVSGSGDQWVVTLQSGRATWPTTLGNPPIAEADWPPGATGYEYREPVGTFAPLRLYGTIFAYTSVGADPLSVVAVAARVVALPMGTTWVTPEMVAAAPVLWSGTPDPAVGADFEVDAAGVAATPVIVAYTDGYPPVLPTGTPEHGLSVFTTVVGWFGTFTYSDHRFIFGTPPLRQFPRDDGLGLPAPRQLPSNPTSRQSSSRQLPNGYL